MSDSAQPMADSVDPEVLLNVLAKMKSGDLSVRLPLDGTGMAGKVALGFNDMIIAYQALNAELVRVSRVVGAKDSLSPPVVVGGSAQSGSGTGHPVNNLIEALVGPISEMERAPGAAAEADLGKKFAMDVQGEMSDLKNTVTVMVDQLDVFAGESNENLERQAHLLAEGTRAAANRIQEIERSNRLFEEEAAQLALSSNRKSEFIANMSHEICTSLNSLLILAEQLADNPEHTMTDTQVEYANSICSSGKELLRLLSSILDLAKVESGTTTAELSVVPIGELRDAMLREFEPTAQEKGLTYSIDVAFDSPYSFVTDPHRLRQILKNLLANAFKFTEHGSIHVAVAPAYHRWSANTAPRAEASPVIAISVSDTGIGIDTEQRQRIFEPFAQGDGATARLYGGTGLGLSISRELVLLLRGEITVTSKRGEGSTFTVYLPTSPLDVMPSADAAGVMRVANDPDPSVIPDDSAVDATDKHVDRRHFDGRSVSAIAGTKILVVDDDFRNIFTLSALLEHSDAEVTVAESGIEALAMLKQLPDIDIVLMDIAMPVMDGYAAIRAVRAIEQLKSLPIIAITGEVTPGERERCIDAGASDYVARPDDTVDLCAALMPWLPAALHLEPVSAGDVAHEPHAERIGQEARRLDSNVHSNPRIEGARILVVEDDHQNIFALSALLEPANGDAEVIVVETGSDALAELKQRPNIDVVLMDIMSHRMDRYDTMRAIRAVEQFKGLPVIAVTGNVMAWERQRFLDAGANEYLPKPLVTTDLLAVLRRWLPSASHSQAV